MAAHFPGADSIDEFLKNLKNSTESIEVLSADELSKLNVEPKHRNDDRFVKVRVSLKNPDYFDAAFFGYTDEEAEIMDPQMRLLHECTWEALEYAGYDTEQYKGTVGLFVGGTPNPLWEVHTLLSDQGGIINAYNSGDLLEAYSKTLLHDKDLMSTRVAYKLNLKGPALTVFTACSTSSVSVHLAIQSILSGECDIAVTGGVSVNFPKKTGYLYEEGMILSSDGHCRSFDANANGTVFGDGIGLLVLKRLENAIEDGDVIHAIIKGSAVNNDGSNRIGFMAPGIEGQAEVMKLAMQVAEVEPDSIAYIEGHGSATKVGDSIEIEAIKSAFKDVEKKGRIAIGSVKTNIGHLNSAAGVAGIIKTILSLKSRMIFPSLHYDNPNPGIENSSLFVNKGLRAFEGNKYPFRALVNSFGAGGTNSSIVLEEPPIQQPSIKLDSPQLIVLSANTKSALKTQTERFSDFLRENSDADFADIAYTLKVGKRSLSYRKYFPAFCINDAIRILDGDISGERVLSSVKISHRKINTVFMFSGQGAQYVNMGLELYKTYRVFREEADRCFNILYAQNGFDLKSIMYPSGDYESAFRRLNEIDIIQPAVFILEYALSKLMLHWGIIPDILFGYSFGEVAAACIAGVFSLEDALEIVNTRGKLMRSTSDGMMLSVPLKAELISLEDGITIAIDNGSSCVVSGTKQAIQDFNNKMKQQKIFCVPVNFFHGARSHLMEPVLDEFLQVLQGISFHEPRYPMISGITGKLLDNNEVIKPSYWVRQLRETVMFAKGINWLLNEQDSIFIELGPGRDLTVLVNSLINNIGNKNRRAFAVDLVRIQGKEVSDVFFILNRLGKLWQKGVKIDWNNYYVNEKRRRITLPTNPFEGKPYWPKSDTKYSFVNNKPAEKPVLCKEPLVDNWFYVPSWKSMPLLRFDKDSQIQNTYLIFHESQFDLENEIVSCLRCRGAKVVTVKPGNSFLRNEEEDFFINPIEYDDYVCLFEELKIMKMLPDRIIDLWPVRDNSSFGSDLVEGFKNAQELGFYSLLKIVKAMEQCSINNKTEINIITYNLHKIIGDEHIIPENATLLSTAKIISQEYLHINCRCIDIHEDSRHGKKAEILAQELEGEFSLPACDRIVAYRGKQRWIQVFEPVKIEQNLSNSCLKKQGTYLITGGLGDIGFNLAKHLIKIYNAKIVLFGRSDFSATDRADNVNEEDNKLNRLKALNDLGGTVLYYPCDISDTGQITTIVGEVEEKLGSFNGIIHAAGVLGKPSTIKYITKEICEEQFRAKVYGLIALAKVFQERKLDFCLMTSSLSNVLGGLGDTSYAAANIYMDYFVQTQRYKGQHNWLSVNWETWFFEKEQKNNSNLGISRIVYSMKVEEGIDTFERIMSCLKVNNILVSAGNFQKRMNMWIELDEIQSNTEDETASKTVKLKSNYNYAQPNSHNEKTLVAIWEKILNVVKIGVKDDFFELGGDSLKAINMISRVCKETGMHIPLSDFFNNPTIEGISGIIGEAPTQKAYIIKPAAQKQYYKASAAQKRLYILNQMEVETTAYNEPIVLKIEGNVEKERIKQVLDSMVSRHEILRTGFDFKDNELVQIIYDKAEPCIKYYHSSEENIEQVIRDFIQPFNLCDPPFIRLGFVYIGEAKSLLILDMHHIVTDGVSEAIIARDFIELYTTNRLPDLTVQYKDFSEWQNEMKENGHFKKQEEYWLKVFETEAPVLSLPYDFPRPPFQDYEGEIHNFTINKTQSDMLRKLARSKNVTLYMLLLASFNVFIHKLSGNEDVVVGTAVSGRNCDEIQNTVGMFVNTIPIRNYPQKKKKFTEFLEEVRDSVLESFNNQDYQFEDLIEKLEITRDPSRNPLFDSMFVWQNMDMPELVISGLNLKSYKYKKNVSKFDLSFIGFESEDDSIKVDIEYTVKLFKPETIGRFAEYFKRIIDVIVKTPDTSLADVDILTPEEQIKNLHEFNNTGRPLSEKNIQDKYYGDWLNLDEQQKIKATQREFWLNEFKSGYAVVNLPTDFKRPPIRVESGGQVAFKLDNKTTLLLQEMAKKTNCTLSVLLLSLFNLLIARLTGQDKVLIGVPVACRRSGKLVDLTGVFVNLLAVQTKINPDLSLEEFILYLTEKMIKIYDNQEFPFEELIEELNVARDPSRNPFFDIAFVMQPLDDLMTCQQKEAKYDLQCTVFLKGEELELTFDYNTSLFKESSIKRISSYFKRLAGQVKEKLSEKISRLELMTEEEKALSFIVGEKGAKVSANSTILQLLDEQAQEHPSNIAVRFGDEEITYGELLVCANKLANKMRKDGVGPTTVVALYITPSIEMIIAILATLKSGGAYLPIDVEYPEERCRFMLHDSSSSYLLTKRDIKHEHLFDSGKVYYVDDKSIYADESEKIQNISNALDVAYIIYTSGTTGKPKGVIVEHRNLFSLFTNTRSIFGFNEKDAWTLFHSHCFDFSVWEIWGALLFGGKLCILSQEQKKDTRQFLELLSRENITVLNQTPSAFYNLSEELTLSEEIFLNIRYIIFGGEELTPVRLKKWSKIFPDVKLFNMYGITETTVHVTIKEITPREIENNTSSIGIPIPGMCAYILDSNGSPLPPGVYGELHVGGAGVSRGYLNRQELTDKVFCRNIYKPTERVFKTGDKARLTDNGEIEYAGRVDRQVQLRGFRIELGEIEHNLLKIPGISDALAIINNQNNDDSHIIAYYVSDREYKLEEIKTFLFKVLPDYMIPSFIIKIEAIPLTSNKKINYPLLPNPKELMEQEQVIAPGNETERKMLSLWSNALQLEEEKISVLKNFFDLGGNSLKIMQLNRLIRDELEISIPGVYLFKYTTIRSLVHFINSGEITYAHNNHQMTKNSLAEGKKRMENMLRRNRKK